MGGTIAQQVARSIATSIADKGVANAMDVNEDAPTPSVQIPHYVSHTAPDPYRDAMLNMAFTTIEPITEPLPHYPPAEPETPLLVIETAPIKQVEFYNLLIGEEKIAALQLARTKGAQNIPDPKDWDNWKVATGAVVASSPIEVITFLLPPQFGKPASGSHTMVEIPQLSDMPVARYDSSSDN